MKSVNAFELIPGRYYQATYSLNTFYGVAVNRAIVRCIRKNDTFFEDDDCYNTSITGARHIREVSKAEAHKEVITNRGATYLLSQEE